MNPRHVHPWVFMVLIVPFGVVGGYVSVTLAYQLKQAGASVEQIAALVALGVLPNTCKFFWAPVVDLTLSQKRWYLIAGFLCAAGVAAMGWFPATKAGLAVLSAVVFLSSLASTLMGMAVESLLAYGTPEELKGRASGWYQAGNLGGAGFGGGLGLYLVEHLAAPWTASCIVGGLCFLCRLALILVPTPDRAFQGADLWTGLTAVFKDFWQLVCNRSGILAFILCLLPIGTGALLFPSFAGEWGASANLVALITGVLCGVISAIGCIVGGWICDRKDRQQAYVWFGVLQAGSAVAMAFLPHTPAMFVIWVSVYNFTSGLCYAAFSAFVLEVIGQGAAATKYNALASLSNVPIYYMTTLDGWAHDRWNTTAMFLTESSLAVVSAGLFLVLVKVLLGRVTPESSPAARERP